jgi:queuine tRNA-ribosyltransferase
VETDSGARAGKLRLLSGIVLKTPLFMPVATKMSVKTLDPFELERTGTEAVITNGFLSSLEPGSDVIRGMGGMHRMMKWKGGIFSDSGGFQFIRKGFDAEISEEGVSLRSPFSGERVFITPESVVDMHADHGVDVGMVLDHCPPYPSEMGDVITSANRTVYWAKRSHLRALELEKDPKNHAKIPLLFAITQGGIHPDIRRDCTSKLVEMDFPGYGIGGLSIGESKNDTFKALSSSTGLIPDDRPRYFMGVGDPDDVVRSVLAGVDIFDSVFPTRNARHRSVFTHIGRENIRSSGWKGRSAPIMTDCQCDTCKNFERGYLYHLFKAGEPLGPRLATIHNIHFMQDLVRKIRIFIIEDEMNPSLSATDVISSFNP